MTCNLKVISTACLLSELKFQNLVHIKPSCIFANFGGLFLSFIFYFICLPQYSYVNEKDNTNNNIYNIE